MTDNMKNQFQSQARQILKQINFETAMLQSGVEAYAADYPGDSVQLVTELERYVVTIKGTNLKLEAHIENNPMAFVLLSEITFESIGTVGSTLMRKVREHGVHFASWNYRTLPRVFEIIKIKYPEEQEGFAKALELAKADHEAVLAGTYKSPQERAAEQFLKAKADFDKINDPSQPLDPKFLQKLGIA